VSGTTSPDGGHSKEIIDVRTTLANYYLSISSNLHAKEAVEPILALALKLNYRKRLPAIYTAMGTYYLYVEEDSRQGLQLIDQATKMAEEVANYFSWWTALYLSGIFLGMISEFEEAHKRLQQCLDFSLMAKNPIGIANSKGAISMCYQFEGKINPAHEFCTGSIDVRPKKQVMPISKAWLTPVMVPLVIIKDY